MVDSNTFTQIYQMLDSGYTYRQIRNKLGVGNWTITKVKKFRDSVLELNGILRSGILTRYIRQNSRKDSLPTPDKLTALWNYWRKIEHDLIIYPSTNQKFLNSLFNILEFSLKSLFNVIFSLVQFFNSLLSFLLSFFYSSNRTVALSPPYSPYSVGGYPPPP